MFEPMELANNTVIKVIGVGGGGGNAIEYMVGKHIEGVEFFAINTDVQALRKTAVNHTIQIGHAITKGFGAGADPEVGRKSAEEDREALRTTLDGADMVFIAAGMGGGTGTGAAPVVAEVAKDLGVLTVAIVTKPFNFEGKKRIALAEQGIAILSKHVDSLIIIPNDKLLTVLCRDVSLLDAFSAANDVLKNAVEGIARLITHPGLMNVDFADVRTVMSAMGYAMIGFGIACGEDRAKEAAEMAISGPLLEEGIDLSDARGVLVNVTAGFDLRLNEFKNVGNTIRSFASDHATVVIGASLDPEMSEELRVTVVATGIISMDKRNEMTIVTNNQASQPVLNDRHHQRYGIAPLLQTVKTTNLVSAQAMQYNQASEDYLDIPTFLRKQEDENII